MNQKIIKSTPFGPVGIIWFVLNGNPRIARVLLSKPGLSAEDRISQLYPDSQMASCSEIESVADAINGIFGGRDMVIPLDIADLGSCSEFQQCVLQAEYCIPRGKVSTYQLIARHWDKHNGARAVGHALATNPFPLIVPCHRAIRSDRHLGGYQGGLTMKRALLEKESIQFDAVGRIVGNHFCYE